MGYYIVFINLFATLCMAVDKYKARHNLWRISEKLLFILAFIGGAIGIYFGMYMFRHKTMHKTFKYGIPALIALNLIIYYLMAL